MGIIAVAGGTGSVGQTIVEALVAHGKHNILILTRKVSRYPMGYGRWGLFAR